MPVGYNPHTGTDDPRREDYDLYAGPQGTETFFEVKMDWMSGLTGRTFIEEKTLRNTKAGKMIVGRLLLDVFEMERLKALYNAKNRVQRGDGSFAEQYVHRHVAGGDQPGNMGMLLDWRTAKAESQPFWLATRELTQPQ